MKGVTIHTACVTGELEALECLLGMGVDVNEPDEDGNPAVLVAAVCSCWPAVMMLLSEPALKLDEVLLRPQQNNLLHIAAQSADQDQFYQLLVHPQVKGAAFPNRDRDTPLHIYVSRFGEDKNKILDTLAKKAPTAINFQNWKGESPLHITTSLKKFEMAKKLIKLGADANTRDEAGETPLHIACRRGRKEFIKILLNAGAKLDISGQNGTPLDVASEETRSYIASIAQVIEVKDRVRSTQFQSHKWEIDLSKVECLGEIGQGGFGTVLRGRWQAIKTVSTGHPVNPRIFEIFGREISLMSQLQHPNILLLIGASLDPSHLCYLTEYMHNGNLRDFLIRNPTLAWSMKFNFALEIARGISYLHGLYPPVIHRDLKSMNVLIDNSSHVKIADFGISKLKELNQTPGGGFTTLNWASPELLTSGEQHTEKSDVYSYGVICWELSSHKIPYEGDTTIQVINAIAEGKTPVFPKKANAHFVELVNMCWNINPANRPGTRQICETMKEIIDEHHQQLRMEEFSSPRSKRYKSEEPRTKSSKSRRALANETTTMTSLPPPSAQSRYHLAASLPDPKPKDLSKSKSSTGRDSSKKKKPKTSSRPKSGTHSEAVPKMPEARDSQRIHHSADDILPSSMSMPNLSLKDRGSKRARKDKEKERDREKDKADKDRDRDKDKADKYRDRDKAKTTPTKVRTKRR